MTPRTLEYENGQIVITLEARGIPELKAIIDKYGDDGALPYLNYVHMKTWPESPYINLDAEEIDETIIYDTIQTIGDFDPDEPLLKPAVERQEKIFTTKLKNYYDSLGVAMDNIAKHLRSTGIESKGKESNMSDIARMIKESGLTVRSFKDVEKQVDDEMKTKMRGKNVLGDY